MSTREYLIERMQAYDPTFPVDDPRFSRLVLDPLSRRLGEDLPQGGVKALVQALLEESFSAQDGSVLADIFGKPGAALFLPLQAELRAALARRQLLDPTVLSQSDLADMRDVFLLDPAEGSFARGVFRVYYTTARSVSFDVTLRFSVQRPDARPLCASNR